MYTLFKEVKVKGSAINNSAGLPGTNQSCLASGRTILFQTRNCGAKEVETRLRGVGQTGGYKN